MTEPYDRAAKMTKKVGTLFPQTDDGCCAVCKEEITNNRKKRYCTDRCREIAYGVQELFLWRKVRKKFIEDNGKVCERCGYDPEEKEKEQKNLEEEIEEKYDEIHSVMTSGTRQIEVDHIKPVSKGGNVFDPDNLQVLCRKCNREKSDKYNGEKNLEDFRERQEVDA